MKNTFTILAISLFTVGFAQETPKKSCDVDKNKKECSTKDKKECSDKNKKECSAKDKKEAKKSCCTAKKATA